MNVLLTLTDPRQCGQCADALFTQYGLDKSSTPSDRCAQSENCRTGTNPFCWPCPTHEADPDLNPPMRPGILCKLSLTRSPDPIGCTTINFVHVNGSMKCSLTLPAFFTTTYTDLLINITDKVMPKIRPGPLA